DLPDPPDARPRQARPLLAHALRRADVAPDVQILVPDVGRGLVLFVFGLFATLSFIEALVLDGRLRHPLAQRVASLLSGGFGKLFMIVGACLGLFIAGYTGVLLAVSNQPVWSDTWGIGGLFLASGLSTAAAAIALF